MLGTLGDESENMKFVLVNTEWRAAIVSEEKIEGCSSCRKDAVPTHLAEKRTHPEEQSPVMAVKVVDEEAEAVWRVPCTDALRVCLG